jgi:hypothetical protein
MQVTTKHDEALARGSAKGFNAKCIEEAPLYFGQGVQDIDQKRGLSINGPADSKHDALFTVRIGIASTGQGIQDTTSCLQRLNRDTVPSSGSKPFVTQSFPGFEQAFNCRLVMSPEYNEEIPTKEIERLLETRNPENRIKRAAELYATKVGVICRRVSVPDVIICHEPERIEVECGAGMASAARERTLSAADRKEARHIREMVETHRILAPLNESTRNLLDMAVHQDFRRVLKAKCLAYDVPTQILTQSVLNMLTEKEGTISHRLRQQDRSTVAWNLAVALYYKANHFPWRVGYIKAGTCYIGISFYQDQTARERYTCSSLAQVFSDTGEGMVVRGKGFKWDTKTQGEPHLTEEKALKILNDALDVYREHHNSQNPNRVVLYKTSRYFEPERGGFLAACRDVPKYDFVSVSDGRDVFFYRNGEKAVLRGTCIELGGESVLIYTKGYIPYQRSYQGPRVPRPLEITEHYGDTPLDEIAKETLALSRLDWNTTDYCCYLPITLKFARRVGDVLGQIPEDKDIKQQYRFYM